MRQAGVLAAAGILALTEMVDRLAEDHAHARQLAEGLAAIPGLALDPARVRTNIVYFDIAREGMTASQLVEGLQREGVRMLASGPRKVRAVTHYEVTGAGIEQALKAAGKVMRG
jgi:threonine aldolase